MATIQFAFSGSFSEGSAFTVRLTNVDSGGNINALATYNSGGTTALVDGSGNALSPAFNFDTANDSDRVAAYSGGTGQQYVTWRNSTAATNTLTFSQYPTMGMSFDIWSDTLYARAATTWTTTISNNGGVYPLTSTKYTLVYNYSNTYPLYFIRGGTVTISSV